MPSAAQSAPSTRLAGLDGLRGIAVAAMVTYHLWPHALPGAFVSLPLFFALSGYLITRGLLLELERTTTITLRRFWARRARRLLPASLVTLALVTVVWSVAGWLTGTVRDDVVWAALQGANWRHIAQSAAYGVNPESSPVMHFWSLSIEEQYYLAIPVIVLFARTRRRVLWVMGAILAISLVAIAISWGDPVVTYFSTLTRAGELAAGGLAGALSVGRRREGARWSADVLALLGLGGLALLTVATSIDMPMYSRGGLVLAGVLSAVACANAVRSRRVGALLDVGPLARLGTISYAVYLVHWPLLVSLVRAGVDGAWARWITVGVTPLVALASDRFLERPIRERRRLVTARRGLVAAAAGWGLLVGAAVAAPVAAPLFDAAEASRLADQRLAELGDGGGAPGAEAGAPTGAPPATVVWVSDSRGLGLVLGIPNTPRYQVVSWFTQMGCPLGRGGAVRSAITGSAQWTTEEKGCDWDKWIGSSFPAGVADVALVAFGTWDLAERRVPQLGNRWTGMGDPAYEAWLASEMRALDDRLLAAGATNVAWLTLSHDPALGPREHVERYNQMLEQLAAEQPGRVRVIDLADWLESTGELERLLPDRIHATFQPDGGTAKEIADRFLYREVERITGTASPTAG